jgi:hypothetical protein
VSIGDAVACGSCFIGKSDEKSGLEEEEEFELAKRSKEKVGIA